MCLSARYSQLIMKTTIILRRLTLLVIFIFNSISYAQYDGAKLNRDGSWSVGGCYDGAKLNRDGSWSVGGAYDGAKLNRDGSWSVGGAYDGAYDGAKLNRDGSWSVGWGKCIK